MRAIYWVIEGLGGRYVTAVRNGRAGSVADFRRAARHESEEEAADAAARLRAALTDTASRREAAYWRPAPVCR